MCKWTGLSGRQRAFLFSVAGDTLGVLLRESPVRLLVLNGRSVVTNFEKITGVRLEGRTMTGWELPRRSQPCVNGVAYRGTVSRLSGIELKKKLLVVGFNHNIQSSFGVTREVRARIRSWIGRQSSGIS